MCSLGSVDYGNLKNNFENWFTIDVTYTQKIKKELSTSFFKIGRK